MDRDVIGTCSPSIFVDEKEEVGQVLQGKGVVSGRVEGFKLKFFGSGSLRPPEKLWDHVLCAVCQCTGCTGTVTRTVRSTGYDQYQVL